jgi:hypothetical protein
MWMVKHEVKKPFKTHVFPKKLATMGICLEASPLRSRFRRYSSNLALKSCPVMKNSGSLSPHELVNGEW